jgi:hypothetical protein
VSHICNTSYSGGRDQDCGWKTVNSLRDPVLKNSSYTHTHTTTHTHKAGELAQGVGPEFKPQYHKKTEGKVGKKEGR